MLWLDFIAVGQQSAPYLAVSKGYHDTHLRPRNVFQDVLEGLRGCCPSRRVLQVTSSGSENAQPRGQDGTEGWCVPDDLSASHQTNDQATTMSGGLGANDGMAGTALSHQEGRNVTVDLEGQCGGW